MANSNDGARSVPKALRIAFIVHFVADVVFAIPLFILPVKFLDFLGWQNADPVVARLVAAALFGIGIESLIGRNASKESFKSMLNLKIIWSSAAIAGFVLSLITYESARIFIVWVLIVVFVVFNLLWVYWRVRMRRL